MDKEAIRQVAIDLMTAMPKGDIARADELLAADLKWSVLGSPGLSRSELLAAAQFMSSAKRAELEKKQSDIESKKNQLSRGGNAMSAEQKEKLMRDIDQQTKALR